MKEQYIDIINNVLSSHDLGNLLVDGTEQNNYVLILYSFTDHPILNDLLKEELQKHNIDTSPDREYDSYYIDFATGDNWGYDDEFDICTECGKAFRKETDYGYNTFWYGDGFCKCLECTKEDAQEYIDSLINNPDTANLILSEKELNGYNFYKANEEPYASGYRGQNDNPKQILAKLLEQNNDQQIIFSVAKTYDPFETQFDIYIKKS